MNKGPFILFRVFGLLLVLGLIAGAGAFGYRAGMARGIEQAPQVAVAIEKAAENGAPVIPIYGYGYPQPYGFGHPHFFNPFGLICGSIILLFFFFGLMKLLFFRRMRHAWGHHGHWRKDWEGKTPPFFDEWHKRAHGEGEKPANTDKKE